MKTSLRCVLYNFFALIPGHPVTWKERSLVGTEEGGPRPISEKESKIYRLAVAVLKSAQNLVISRCSCGGMAKKCTKRHDARAELLFCSLNLLLFWRSRCLRRRSYVKSWRKSYPVSLKYYLWVLANWLSALSFLSRWWTESKVATVFHRLWYVMATCYFHNF